MDTIQIVMLMLGWTLFGLAMLSNKTLKDECLYRGERIKDWERHCKKLAQSHGRTLQPLYDVLQGKKKSFLFNGKRFRLCYEGKGRNKAGKYTKVVKQKNTDGVLKRDLQAK